MNEYEFVANAIRNLRKPPYNGIHSVYSGFNAAFRDYFGEDPIAATKKLAMEGKIEIKPSKGGVVLYLPDDKPYDSNSKISNKSQRILDKILG